MDSGRSLDSESAGGGRFDGGVFIASARSISSDAVWGPARLQHIDKAGGHLQDILAVLGVDDAARSGDATQRSDISTCRSFEPIGPIGSEFVCRPQSISSCRSADALKSSDEWLTPCQSLPVPAWAAWESPLVSPSVNSSRSSRQNLLGGMPEICKLQQRQEPDALLVWPPELDLPRHQQGSDSGPLRRSDIESPSHQTYASSHGSDSGFFSPTSEPLSPDRAPRPGGQKEISQFMSPVSTQVGSSTATPSSNSQSLSIATPSNNSQGSSFHVKSGPNELRMQPEVHQLTRIGEDARHSHQMELMLKQLHSQHSGEVDRLVAQLERSQHEVVELRAQGQLRSHHSGEVERLVVQLERSQREVVELRAQGGIDSEKCVRFSSLLEDRENTIVSLRSQVANAEKLQKKPEQGSGDPSGLQAQLHQCQQELSELSVKSDTDAQECVRLQSLLKDKDSGEAATQLTKQLQGCHQKIFELEGKCASDAKLSVGFQSLLKQREQNIFSLQFQLVSAIFNSWHAVSSKRPDGGNLLSADEQVCELRALITQREDEVKRCQESLAHGESECKQLRKVVAESEEEMLSLRERLAREGSEPEKPQDFRDVQPSAGADELARLQAEVLEHKRELVTERSASATLVDELAQKTSSMLVGKDAEITSLQDEVATLRLALQELSALQAQSFDAASETSSRTPKRASTIAKAKLSRVIHKLNATPLLHKHESELTGRDPSVSAGAVTMMQAKRVYPSKPAPKPAFSRKKESTSKVAPDG